jgi:iron-sulfur cluster assembly accessory protein
LQILVDPASQPLLQGVEIDFVDSINGGGFKFINPNATASCGCGKSFAA